MKRTADSLWCGGVACVLIIVNDIAALMWGGRHQVPIQIAGVMVAGLLLPIINLYFILKDVHARRYRDAALGLSLSLAAMLLAFDPPWNSLVRRGDARPQRHEQAQNRQGDRR